MYTAWGVWWEIDNRPPTSRLKSISESARCRDFATCLIVNCRGYCGFDAARPACIKSALPPHVKAHYTTLFPKVPPYPPQIVPPPTFEGKYMGTVLHTQPLLWNTPSCLPRVAHPTLKVHSPYVKVPMVLYVVSVGVQKRALVKVRSNHACACMRCCLRTHWCNLV